MKLLCQRFRLLFACMFFSKRRVRSRNTKKIGRRSTALASAALGAFSSARRCSRPLGLAGHMPRMSRAQALAQFEEVGSSVSKPDQSAPEDDGERAAKFDVQKYAQSVGKSRQRLPASALSSRPPPKAAVAMPLERRTTRHERQVLEENARFGERPPQPAHAATGGVDRVASASKDKRGSSAGAKSAAMPSSQRPPASEASATTRKDAKSDSRRRPSSPSLGSNKGEGKGEGRGEGKGEGKGGGTARKSEGKGQKLTSASIGSERSGQLLACSSHTLADGPLKVAPPPSHIGCNPRRLEELKLAFSPYKSFAAHDPLFTKAPYLHSPIKQGLPPVASPRASLPDRPSNPTIVQGGFGVGINWYPHAEELLANEASDEPGARPVHMGTTPTPLNKIANLEQREAERERRASERIAREAAATAAALRSQHFVITLHEICAHDVRSADAESGSDPYADFTLLECDQLPADGRPPPSDKTSVIRNAREPRWDAPCRVVVPAGTRAALSLSRLWCGPEWVAASRYLTHEQLTDTGADGLPSLRVRVLDKDPGEASDDLIGVANVRLRGLTGQVEGLMLPCDAEIIRAQQQRDEQVRAQMQRAYDERVAAAPNAGKRLPSSPLTSARRATSNPASARQPSSRHRGDDGRSACTMSFKYEIEPYEPAPPALLTIRSVRVDGIELRQPPTATGGEGEATPLASGGAERKPAALPATVTASEGAGMRAPYLQVRLLEVGNAARAAATVTSRPASHELPQPWAEATWLLKLPSGSPRPPLLHVALWDAGQSICDSDCRLQGERGSAEVTLHYISTIKGMNKVRSVTVRFEFELKTQE